VCYSLAFCEVVRECHFEGVCCPAEFGAYSNGFGDDLTDANHLLGLADANLQSWSYWQFKSYGDPTTSDVDAQVRGAL
jgi:hypothetical protein